MTINDIANDIIEDLCPNISADPDDNTISGFIQELSNERDITSLRLLLCIGIDLKNSIAYTGFKNPSQNKYISNLRQCILNASNCTISTASFPRGLTARWKFTWSMNRIPLDTRIPCIEGIGKSQYARVSAFNDYMKYVVGPNKEHNPGIDVITNETRDLARYYIEFTSSKKKYSSIIVSKLSHFRYIFVIDIDDIKAIGYGNIDNIIDGLGFYVENISATDNYILFEYDVDFKELTWQPDCLTGDWGKIDNRANQNGNDFFLSRYHSDHWGRTFSVSGSDLSFKERVHLPFDGGGVILYQMNAVDLKNLTSLISKCSDDSIISEALLRYLKAKNL